MRTLLTPPMSTRLMGSGAMVGGIRGGVVVDRGLRSGDGGLAVEVGDAVWVGLGSVGGVGVALEGVGVAVGAVDGLGSVRDDLHSPRDCACGGAATSSVCGCRGTAEALGELLDEGIGDIVCGDVDCVGDA